MACDPGQDQPFRQNARRPARMRRTESQRAVPTSIPGIAGESHASVAIAVRLVPRLGPTPDRSAFRSSIGSARAKFVIGVEPRDAPDRQERPAAQLRFRDGRPPRLARRRGRIRRPSRQRRRRLRPPKRHAQQARRPVLGRQLRGQGRPSPRHADLRAVHPHEALRAVPDRGRGTELVTVRDRSPGHRKGRLPDQRRRLRGAQARRRRPLAAPRQGAFPPPGRPRQRRLGPRQLRRLQALRPPRPPSRSARARQRRTCTPTTACRPPRRPPR